MTTDASAGATDVPAAGSTAAVGSSGSAAAGTCGSGTAPRRFGTDLVLALPELVAAAVAGFALPAMVLLLTGQFRSWLVLPIGLVCAAAALLAHGVQRQPYHEERDRSELLCLILAALLALGWIALNAHRSAQDIVASRDPATYGITGEWLTHNHALPIHTAPQVFGSLPPRATVSAGFGYVSPGTVYPQGNHLLPVILATGGWIGGSGALLNVNVVIGGLALFAFYGLARRFVGGALALVAMLALAVSMPMLAFSRDTYSEPLNLLLVIGGLSILWRALQSDRTRLYAVAGLVVGASAMARVDSYASLLWVIPFLGLVLAMAPRERRVPVLRRAVAFAVPAGVGVFVGWRDLIQLSSGYADDRGDEVGLLALAGVGLGVLTVVVITVAWSTRWLHALLTEARRRVTAIVAGALVVVAGGLLASRPLWLDLHHNGTYPGMEALQKGLRLPIDGRRTYDEHTLSWIGWYYGWLTLALAVIGLALLVYRFIRTPDLRQFGLVAMTLSMSLLYFNRSSIVPDQVWAMRRFLPTIIPGLLLAAVSVVYLLWKARPWLMPVAAGLAVATVAVPAAITWPMERVRTGVPQLAIVRQICAAVGDKGAILTVDASTSSSLQQTLRAYCDVPAASYLDPTSAQLSTVAAAATHYGRTVYILGQTPETVNGKPDEPAFASAVVSKWPERLVDVPQHGNSHTETYFLAKVQPSGIIVPVPAGTVS